MQMDGDIPRGQNWFFDLFGFVEEYRTIRDRMTVQQGTLVVNKTGRRFAIGQFNTPTLKDLRSKVQRVTAKPPGQLKLDFVFGDVTKVHADPKFKFATFQVASQFNCLEFANPNAIPEEGITVYVEDRTQGPACSIACAPATVYRNYFHSWTTPQGKQMMGQDNRDMLNNLDILTKLISGEGKEPYFNVEGGYIFATPSQLQKMKEKLELDKGRLGDYLDVVKVGVHEDVQVTSTDWGRNLLTRDDQLVTQVFGSACSIAYNRCSDPDMWEPLGRLVLDASYQAVLMTAILNAQRHSWSYGSNKVVLTMLGGGVFGNPVPWILQAIRKACEAFEKYPLEVYINLMDESHLHPADIFVMKDVFGKGAAQA